MELLSRKSRIFLRLQSYFCSSFMLSGLLLAATFFTSLFGFQGLSFQLAWAGHILLHCVSFGLALTLIIRFARELNDTLLLFYLTCLVVLCAVIAVTAFLPWFSHSGLSLELPLARAWMRAGYMQERPLLPQAMLPAGLAPIYVGFFQNQLPFLISAYHTSYALILAAFLMLLVYYKCHEEEISLWAVMILLCNPYLVAYSGQPGGTLPAACFFAYAYGGLLFWAEQRGRWYWLMAIGLALGIAGMIQAAVGLVLGGVLILGCFGFFLSWKLPTGKALFSLIGILVSTLVGLSPWLFRNFLWSDSILPWKALFRNPPPIALSIDSWMLSFLLLLISAFPLFRKSKNLQRISPWTRFTWLLFIVGGVLLWRTSGGHLEELFLPLLLPAILLTATGIEMLLEKRKGRQAERIIRWVLVTQIVLALSVSVWSKSLIDVGSYFIGKLSKMDYVSKRVDDLELVHAVQKNLPATSGLYIAGLDLPIYYLKKPVIGLSDAGEGLGSVLDTEGDSRRFAQRLLLEGVTHLLMQGPRSDLGKLHKLTPQQQQLWQDFLKSYTEVVQEGERACLLKVRSGPQFSRESLEP